MCVHVYACMCVCIHHIGPRTAFYILTGLLICMCVHIYVCVCVHITCINCVCMCKICRIYVCSHVCMCVCIHHVGPANSILYFDLYVCVYMYITCTKCVCVCKSMVSMCVHTNAYMYVCIPQVQHFIS